ncbi:ArnT family glycosyltransferase [Candidatus Moduliflexota bacterium]
MGIFILPGTVLLLLLSLARGGPPLHPALFSSPLASALAVCAGLTLFLLPAAAPVRRRMDRLLFQSRRPVLYSVLFFGTAAAAAAISFFIFDTLPYIDDGVAAQFQARIFSRGSITLPLPAQAEFFELFGILGARADLGHWAGMYPPGWPALLVPGVLIGTSWIVNPLLGGALVLTVAELGRELHGERTGRIAGLLTAASPALLILAGTHLSHTATALFGALCLLSVFRLTRTGLMRHGFAAGIFWGAAFLCRPLDALLLGALFALVPLFRLKESVAAWRGVLLALLLSILSAGILAAFQNTVTGNPLTPGHTIGMARLGGFGFIPLGEGHAHTPARGAETTLKRLRAVNDHLSGWPIPFLFVALVPFWRRERRKRDLFLLACPLLLAAVFFFYWYWEAYFPGRYLASAFPMLLVLAARGLVLLGKGPLGPAFHALAAASLLFTAASALPWEFRALERNAGDVEQTLPRVVEAYGIEGAVVFMDSVTPGVEDLERLNDFYATGFLRNSLDLDDDVLFARNSRNENHLLIESRPGKDYYLYRYHRDSRRALLYRLVPRGREFCLYPVEPLETELLVTDAGPVVQDGSCREGGQPP